MRSYRIVETVNSLHRNYVLHLYEAGIEEVPLVFESRDRAYDVAMKYVAGEIVISYHDE